MKRTSRAPKKLIDFKPLSHNPNQHTARGMSALEDSVQQDGFVAPMTAAADGTILDGNARLETVATALPVDPIVIEHDGKRPIIAVRTDIPNERDPRARRIALAANRVASVNLTWDADAVRALIAGDDLALPKSLWSDAEMKQMLREIVARSETETTLNQERYLVVVTCTSEQHQAELLERFANEGLSCRALIS